MLESAKRSYNIRNKNQPTHKTIDVVLLNSPFLPLFQIGQLYESYWEHHHI